MKWLKIQGRLAENFRALKRPKNFSQKLDLSNFICHNQEQS